MEIPMNRSCLQVRRWIAVVVLVLAAGCQSKPGQQSRWGFKKDETMTAQAPLPAKLPPSAQDDTPAPALAGPTSPEVKLNAPGLVQQRVSNYVQEIGPLADNRHTPGPSSQPV